MGSKLRKWLNWNVYQDALEIAVKIGNVKLQQAIVISWTCNVNLPGDIRRIGSDVEFQNKVIKTAFQKKFIVAAIKRYCIDADPFVELTCKTSWEDLPSVPMGNFRDPKIISWVKSQVRPERYSFTVLEPIAKKVTMRELKRIIYGDKYVRI